MIGPAGTSSLASTPEKGPLDAINRTRTAFPYHSLIHRLLYLSGVLALAVNALVLWPVLGRLGSTVLVGKYASFLALVALAAPIASGGLHVILLRDVSSNRDDVSRMASRLAHLTTRAFLILGLTCSVVFLPVTATISSIVFASFAMAAVFVALADSRGSNSPWRFAGLNIASQTLGPAAGGVILFRTGSISLSLALLGSIAYGWSFLSTRHPALREHSGNSLRLLAGALRRSVGLVPHLVLTVLILQGVRVVFAIREGYTQAAILQFALILGSIPITAVTALGGYWAAYAYRTEDWEQFCSSCRTYGDRLTKVAALLVSGTVAASPFILPYWLPSGIPRADVFHATALIAPAAVLQAQADLQSTRAIRIGYPASLSIATSAGALVAVIGVLATSPYLGLRSIGVFLSLGILTRLIVSSYLLHRRGVSAHFTPSVIILTACLFGAACILTFA